MDENMQDGSDVLEGIAFVGETLGPFFLQDPKTGEAGAAFQALAALDVDAAAAEWPFADEDEARAAELEAKSREALPVFKEMAAEGNEKGLALQHFVLWFVKYAAFGLVAFLGVYLGAEPVAAIVNQIPANVMSGLNAVGALLPAVGMALLLQMLWSTELSIYFFLGFTLYQYLGLPMIAIAVLGVIIAVASALRDKEIFDLTKKGVAAQAVSGDSVTNDEEDFFA